MPMARPMNQMVDWTPIVCHCMLASDMREQPNPAVHCTFRFAKENKVIPEVVAIHMTFVSTDCRKEKGLH